MNNYMTRRSWLGAASMFAVSGVAAGQEDFTKLPPNLPVPLDDGACDHLLHMQVPPHPSERHCRWHRKLTRGQSGKDNRVLLPAHR